MHMRIFCEIPPLYERKNEIQCATVYHVKLCIFYAKQPLVNSQKNWTLKSRIHTRVNNDLCSYALKMSAL